MEKAPRRVWVSVAGYEHDSVFGGLHPRPWIQVGVPGTSGKSDVREDWAQVTDVFDIADITPALTTFPIELATGDFELAFTVFARLKVDAFVPAAFINRELRPRLLKPFIDLHELGKTLMISDGGGGNPGHMVGLGADGAIYHTRLAPERPAMRDQGWSRLSGPVNTPVKAIAGRDGGLRLFAFDGKGGVLFQKPGKDAGKTGVDEARRTLRRTACGRRKAGR